MLCLIPTNTKKVTSNTEKHAAILYIGVPFDKFTSNHFHKHNSTKHQMGILKICTKQGFVFMPNNTQKLGLRKGNADKAKIVQRKDQ
jgi:hypothetical protein